MEERETMRTIKENLMYRLATQASEAELQGLTKVAEALTDQIEKHGNHVRANGDFYSYPDEEFKKDIVSQFWGAIIRIADFYDIRRFDAAEVQSLIDKMAQEMITELCVRAGIKHGVGAYEPPVSGEELQHVGIEVDEEDI